MATSLYDQFKTNPTLEREGVEVEYGINKIGEPIRFRVSRMGQTNTKFQKVSEQRLKPYRRQLQTETMDTEVANKLMREIFVDTILMGWTGVEDRDGNPLPFNRENAIKLFSDLPDLYDDLRETAGKAAVFREQVAEADSGN